MPYLMMNGFMLLTITKTGQVTETYYQHDGTRAPWVNSNTYQLGGSCRCIADIGEQDRPS